MIGTNIDIIRIEEELKIGQVPPPRLAEHKDWLAAEATSMMDRQNALSLAFAEWYFSHKDFHKTDKARDLAWRITDLGKEQAELDLRQRKIKTLKEAISAHLRVAHDMAFNHY